MPVSYSANQIRNEDLYNKWDNIPDSTFKKLRITLNEFKKLQDKLNGWIVLPGDAAYNKDRMLANPRFDYFPLAIVYCVSISDVRLTLLFVQQENAEFCVRSGGHCTAGFSSGPGILIDVSHLNGISVDAAARTATVGCGVKFGDLDNTLDLYGLNVPGGECPDVCVGGYVQGGGYGFTSCTFGMSCDNVISMTVLLANGDIVQASATQNFDLWWAMRGGTGGNFGILLSLTYQLYELTDVYGFALLWPLGTDADASNAADVMMKLQESYMFNSPYDPNLNLQVSLAYQSKIHDNEPNGDFKPYFLVRGCYVGDPADGANAIRPLQQLAGCITQWQKSLRFNKMNQYLLDHPQKMPALSNPVYEDKVSRYVSEMLDHETWKQILSYFPSSQVNRSYGYLEFYGGQIKQDTLNCFMHRNVAYNAVMDVFWYDDVEREKSEAFLEGWKQLLEPVWNGHVYQNYPSSNDPNYAFQYWGDYVDALSRVKAKYDPGNVFRFAQQVPMYSGPVDAKLASGDYPPELPAALAEGIDYQYGSKA
ncbi:MAG: FAD-binding oxidoreductase [Pseudomonadota bacterium]